MITLFVASRPADFVYRNEREGGRQGGGGVSRGGADGAHQQRTAAARDVSADPSTEARSGCRLGVLAPIGYWVPF